MVYRHLGLEKSTDNFNLEEGIKLPSKAKMVTHTTQFDWEAVPDTRVQYKERAGMERSTGRLNIKGEFTITKIVWRIKNKGWASRGNMCAVMEDFVQESQVEL